MKRFLIPVKKNTLQVSKEAVPSTSKERSQDGTKNSDIDKNRRIFSSSDEHELEQPSLSTKIESPHPRKRRRLTEIARKSCPSDSNDSSDEPDSDDISNINPVDSREGTSHKKKSYRQKFKSEWKKQFAWLESKSGKPSCIVCLKVIQGGITHLKRHELTIAHRDNFEKSSNTPEITTFFDDQKNTDKLLKAGELIMTMFLHEHNLPLSLMDHLPKMVASVVPDSKLAPSFKCGRTKATALTKDCIAKEQMQQIAEKLQKSPFSIIVDETTDISTQKSLAIVARFYDEGQCKDKFLGLVRVFSGTAEALFDTICTYLKVNNVPIANMVGLAADNAAVMMGNISGLKARFKQILPNLFVLGCVCHSFHLCSSAAAKELPRSLEDFIRGIYNYFAHSSIRQETFQKLQKIADLKPHKLLRPSQTRWLSLQAAVDRVLEKWDVLIRFFECACTEDKLHSTQMILTNLQNPIFKIYCTFLSYILEAVNRLNLEFQAEKPKLHLLLNRVKDLYRNILRNFITKEYLDKTPIQSVIPDNPRHFIALEKIYFGAKTEVLLSENKNLQPNELHNFKLQALAFYIALSNQIKSRFNFIDPVLEFVGCFNPKVALSGEISSIATQALTFFPQLVDDIEKLNSEWRLLPDLEELKAHVDDSIEEFWTNIFNLKSQLKDLMFPNLTKLVKGILCLPHSSAAAERVFSQLNLMRTETRNRLNIDTCDSIMHAKELFGGHSCYSWQPSSTLLKRKPVYSNCDSEEDSRDKENATGN